MITLDKPSRGQKPGSRRRIPLPGRTGRWLRITSVVAAASLALTGVGASSAMAAPGDTSAAEARFLAGSLLAGGVSLDEVALLAGATASNTGQPDADVATSDLDLTALNLLTVALPGGVTLPLGDFIELGAVNQYAQASDAGVSRAATGAVSDSGVVDLNGSDEFPANATVHLSDLLGDDLSEVIADLDLELGAVTAQASLNADGPQVDRDYGVAGAQMRLTVPGIGQLTPVLLGDGAGVPGVAGRLDAAVDDLAGSDGVLAAVLAAVSGVGGLAGNDGLEVTIDSDVAAALNAVLDDPLSDPAVSINLRTGVVEVNLDALLQAEQGFGLNDLPIGREILSEEVLTALAGRISTLLNTVPGLVESAVDEALRAADLHIEADVTILGSEVEIAVDGTIAQVLDGTGDASLIVRVPDLADVEVDAATLLAALATPITAGLFGPEGIIEEAVPTVTTAITSLTAALGPVLEDLNELVSLVGNIQSQADGQYTQIALRLSVGDLVGDGGLARVEFARATVGPNALADSGVPTITGLDPDQGPLAGGTEVTITGSGFVPGSTVTFGGQSAAVVSVADGGGSMVVTSPSGTTAGPVPVVVTSPDGSSDPGQFTYLPPGLTAQEQVAAGEVASFQGTGWPPNTAVSVQLVSPGEDPVGSPVVVTSNDLGGFTGTIRVPATAAPGAYTLAATDEFENAADAPLAVTAVGAPVVTGLEPDEGPLAGGTEVTISGSGFLPGSTVTFDGRAATVVTISDTGDQIVVQSPSGTVAGPVDVVVTTTVASSDPGQFTYLAPGFSADDDVAAGEEVDFEGSGWPPNTPVAVQLIDPDGNPVGEPVSVTTDQAGAFSGSILVPAGASPGGYTLEASDQYGNQGSADVTVRVAGSPGGGGGGGGGGDLPMTGAGGWAGLLAAGLLALGGGAAMLSIARRRHAAQAGQL